MVSDMRKIAVLAMSIASALVLCREVQCQTPSVQEQLSEFRRLDKINPDDALNRINQEIAKHPDNIALQKFRWYLGSRTGRTIEILTSQRHDYEVSRNAALAELMLWCHAEAEHFDEAIALSKVVARDQPNNPEILYYDVWMSYKNLDYKAALQGIQRMAKFEDSPRVRGWRALLVGTTGRFDEARELFEKDEKRCGASIPWLLTRSLFLSLIDDREESFKSYRKALSLTPSSPTERQERSRFLWFSGVALDLHCLAEDLRLHSSGDAVPEKEEELYCQMRVLCLSSAADSAGTEKLLKTVKAKFKDWRACWIEHAFSPYNPAPLYKAVLSNPTQGSIYYQLATHATSTTKKIDLLSKALDAYRNNTFVACHKAWLLESAKKYQQSIEVLARLRSLVPFDMSVARQYYITVAKHRSLNEALALIDRECQTSPCKLRLLTTKAEVLKECGKVAQAHQLAKGLTQSYPQSEQSWYVRAVLLDGDGRLEEAGRVVTEGLKTSTRSRALLLLRAQLSYRQERISEALADINRLIEKTNVEIDQDVDVLYLRATCYLRLNRIDDAIRDFEKCCNNRPSLGVDWLDLVFPKLDISQDRLARNLCENTVTRRPNSECEIRYSYAKHFLMRIERCDQALASVGRCLSLRPNDVNFHMLRLEALKKLNRQAEVSTEEKLLSELAPKDTQIWIQRADSLIAMKKRNQAFKVISEGLQKNPTSVDLLYYRMTKFEDMLNDEQRLSDYKKILKEQPANQQALIGVINVQKSRNNYGEVIKACQAYHETHPTDTRLEAIAIGAMLSL